MSKITGQIRKECMSEPGDNRDNGQDKPRYYTDKAEDKEDKGQDMAKITDYLTVISDGNHGGSCGRSITSIGMYDRNSKCTGVGA